MSDKVAPSSLVFLAKIAAGDDTDLWELIGASKGEIAEMSVRSTERSNELQAQLLEATERPATK
jgi:hypothetical protein